MEYCTIVVSRVDSKTSPEADWNHFLGIETLRFRSTLHMIVFKTRNQMTSNSVVKAKIDGILLSCNFFIGYFS